MEREACFLVGCCCWVVDVERVEKSGIRRVSLSASGQGNREAGTGQGKAIAANTSARFHDFRYRGQQYI